MISKEYQRGKLLIELKIGRKDTGASPIVIESPVYRQQFGLWEHQKYFIDKAFNDHKCPMGQDIYWQTRSG